MNRLTMKTPFDGYVTTKGVDAMKTMECLNKLGEYEDLEEDNKINYRKVLQCKHGTKVYVSMGARFTSALSMT